MNENIYSPPLSDVEVETNHKGSPVKAIVVATAVDILGTIIVAIAFNVAYTLVLTFNGMPMEEIAAGIASAGTFSFYSLSGYVLGCLMTVLAGYLCARIVNYSEYKYVAIYCAIIIVFGTVMGWASSSASEMLLLPVLSIGSAFLGAWLYVRNK